MITSKFFISTLKTHHIDFFAGVPDSLLKSMCAYITDTCAETNNIIAANEGAAIGVAVGYHLATGKTPCVYMQNSGEGNAINPLMSLTDKEVYQIPILLIIGWRGKPGIKDEPQHKKQGRVTLDLLRAMEIPYQILSKEEIEAKQQINAAVDYLNATGESYALIVEKDTFEPYTIQHIVSNNLTLSREDAIKMVVDILRKEDIVVSTTGMISRELFEYREFKQQGHSRDFLTVGSMGHASQIALGIAIQKPQRRIFCFDGDGAAIMHLGSMAVAAQKHPHNYYHIVFNNGAHDSVGGQPTVGLDVNLCKIADSCGYTKTFSVDSAEKLTNILPAFVNTDGPTLLEIRVKKGNRKDLGRPTSTPIENKNDFMNFVK